MSTPLLQIPAEDLLRKPGFRLLDVRAEVEFEDGHLPGSTNLPLLNNQERHEVGTVYKQEGQAAAISLGYALVSPHRAERVEGWKRFLAGQSEPVLTCFRGGMRSEIAQSWLAEEGVPSARVRGGYKAMRRVLVREWEKPLRGYVVTGLTGVNKTGFVRSLRTPRALDLEAFALHRGSAFGGLFQPGPQPSQQTFENALALGLFQNRGGDFLFEDESRLIGRRVIPTPFFEQLRMLPRIYLEATDEERCLHIYREYVETPLRERPVGEVLGHLVNQLRTLRNRMGGKPVEDLEAALRRAFAEPDPESSRELHRIWILRLLLDYYDGLYRHAMSRHPNEPVFRGNAEACREWLRQNADLFV